MLHVALFSTPLGSHDFCQMHMMSNFTQWLNLPKQKKNGMCPPSLPLSFKGAILVLCGRPVTLSYSVE